MAAEMVIRLVDGSSDTSSSLSPANQLPTAHNPDIPTVASSRVARSTQSLATVETDPRKVDSASVKPGEVASEARTSEAITIDSMEEFTRRLEIAIQEWGKRAKPDEKQPGAQNSTQTRSATEQILDAIEQRLPKRAQSVFQRVRRSKVWQNPTVRRMAARAKSSVTAIARKVGNSKFAKRLAASKIGQAVKSRGGAWLTQTASALGLRGAASGAASAGAAGSAGASAGAGAGGAAAGAGGAAVAGVAAVAAPVAVTVAAFVALVGATYALHRRFKTVADELEGFSGQISAARARAQANTTINMVDRARAIGPQLGRLENANTRFQDSTEKLWTQILQVLIKAEPALTKIVDGMSVGIDMGAQAVAALGLIKAALTKDLTDDFAAAQNFLIATTKVQQSMRDFAGLPPLHGNNNPFDQQLAAFLQQNFPNMPPPNPPPMGGGMP
ncbi:hypothetical protein SH449x_004121 [Pirellulaceae bacterium SH449]